MFFLFKKLLVLSQREVEKGRFYGRHVSFSVWQRGEG